MSGAEEMIRELQGNSTLTCYNVLLQAVRIACEYLPAQLLMKDLAEQIAPAQNPDSVQRALARATEAIWDSGRRRILEKKYGFRCKPTPKELIYKLARVLKNPVKYRIWQENTSGRYGIIASETVEDRWFAVAPLFKDKNTAAAVVRILNESNVSLEAFQELCLNGGFLALVEEKYLYE